MSIYIREILTHSTSLYLFCRNPQNRENLDHYLNEYIHHLRGCRHFCVDLQPSEKHLDAFKYIDKSVLACPNILSCLRRVGITINEPTRRCYKMLHTKRRTPTPANITFAGENICQIDMRAQIRDTVTF